MAAAANGCAMVVAVADGHRPVTRGMSALTRALRRTSGERVGRKGRLREPEGKGAQKRAETEEGGHCRYRARGDTSVKGRRRKLKKANSLRPRSSCGEPHKERPR